MTLNEFGPAALAVIGLAGCAMALVALAFDWRDGRRPIAGWHYTMTVPLETGVNPTRIDQ